MIADDITGGTDLASAMRDAGLRVLQSIGVPSGPLPAADAVIVSQKTRTIPSVHAVEASLAAARWLDAHGARTIYFKYCSTFDSTDDGNIGPVVAALLDEVGESFTIACPAYPRQGRTVYQGHLFVGDRLLSESSMQDHPLTPMQDADLVRVLGRQYPAPVGLVALDAVRSGAGATRARFVELERAGRRVAIADATTEVDLATLAEACDETRLATGAAGLGQELARRVATRRTTSPVSDALPRAGGPAVVLSGSCSAATLAQVRHFAGRVAARRVSPGDLASGALPSLIAWAREQASRGDLMLYSTAPPTDVQRTQAALGRDEAAHAIESLFRIVATALRDSGVRTFVVAGGETSGAVLEALDIRTIGFGDAIAPGVPAVISLDPPGFSLALKSGNFGDVDFFPRAVRALRGE